MRRRVAVIACLVFAAFVLAVPSASAHAALRTSDPAAGSALGVAPAAVRLTFSEEPEPSLSRVAVVDRAGATFETGPLSHPGGDPSSLSVALRPMGRGSYVVSWRVVSAADGHATSGSFAFGVGQLPDDVVATSDAADSTPSALEAVGRWSYLAGLILMVGIAVAVTASFGRSQGPGWLGVIGGTATTVGLALLAEAQRRSAAASLGDLLGTPIGHALAWRAAGVALALLGVALMGNRNRRQLGAAVTLVGAVGAIAAHVDAGHAVSAGAWRWAEFAFQSTHVIALGVWLGGLVVLLADLRGAPSTVKASRVRRFSAIALGAFAVVIATGAARGLGEIHTLHELASSSYGRVVLIKSAIVVVIGAFAARNRWRNVRAAETDLIPLRRTIGGEVALAAAALVAATMLAGLAPPAAARDAGPSGLVASGADFATTTRVTLTATSPLPGPNRFVVHIEDFDSGRPIVASHAGLRFTPMDDPGVATTGLALAARADGSYAALGANLAFDGRWRVDVEVEQPNRTTTVPLVLETRRPAQFLSITRIPGEPPVYTVQIADETLVNFAIDPERPGPSTITVSFADVISDERDIASLVLTTDSSESVRQFSGERVSTGRFAVPVDLASGSTRVTAIARTSGGVRLWAQFDLRVR